MPSKASNVLFNAVEKDVWLSLDLQGQTQIIITHSRHCPTISLPILNSHCWCLTLMVITLRLVCVAGSPMFCFPPPTGASFGEGTGTGSPTSRHGAFHREVQISGWECRAEPDSLRVNLGPSTGQASVLNLLCKMTITKIHTAKVELRIHCVHTSKMVRIIPGI